MTSPQSSAQSATPLAQQTSVISPNGGLTRWFVGLLCVALLLVGCLLASRTSGSATLYPLGLLIAISGLAALVVTIKRGFDQAERRR